MRVLQCQNVLLLFLLLGTEHFFVTVNCQLCEGNPSPSPKCARPACNGATCDANMGCGLCSPCQCRSLGMEPKTFECRACSKENCQCSNLLIGAGTPEQPCCDGLTCMGSGSKPAVSLGSCKKVS